MSLIIEALQFARICHLNQCRKYNGAPYITHPIRVAGRVATHEMATEELVAAAFLHDVIEDCDVTFDTINEKFGSKVANYVQELTNLPKQEGVNRRERKRLDRERIGFISKEAKLVKLIDRIDNIREIDPFDSFAEVYAQESLLLLDVLVGVDSDLEEELNLLCQDILNI